MADNSYLGISLARVLLASRPDKNRKPILVISVTNHALDNFLAGLREAGITGLARLGSQSKEEWTNEFRVRNIQKRTKMTGIERSRVHQAYVDLEGLTTEGISWCESIINGTLSWPAVQEYLNSMHPDILSHFTNVEKPSKARGSESRLARKAGGFAYEYWCQGGDLEDISLLLQHFQFLAARTGPIFGDKALDISISDRMQQKIRLNVFESLTTATSDDIWSLGMSEREKLLKGWQDSISTEKILDTTAEVTENFV